MDMKTKLIWLERVARFGCATKGIVYFLLGILAIQLFLGVADGEVSSEGALVAVANQFYGRPFLSGISAGLGGYAMYCFIEASFNPGYGRSPRQQWLSRLKFGLRGTVHAGLAWSAGRFAYGDIQLSDESEYVDWTANVLTQPLGRWVVAMGGIAILCGGLYNVYMSISQKYRQHYQLTRINCKSGLWAMNLGRFGVGSRGLVYALIGVFILQAAIRYDPSLVRGLDGTLQTISRQPLGQFGLGFVAFGFLAYSIHMVVEAKYRQMAALRRFIEQLEDRTSNSDMT